MYGRARLGHDVFLGEVVIPLREVEGLAELQQADKRRYILGRRNAKEKVSRPATNRKCPSKFVFCLTLLSLELSMLAWLYSSQRP